MDMSENTERGKGLGDQIMGKARQAMGNLTGNESQETHGQMQEMSGEGRQEAAKDVGYAKGSMDDLKGNIKQGIGGLTGNKSTQGEGMLDELKGDVRKKLNQ
jgi:uncharacterized protein YjbJ (UPF0337 family)